MKLEHGKKYITALDTIVGPLTQLHDGRFSYREYVWDESGLILLSHGKATLADSVLSITREYNEPDPNETTSEYKHEQVGVTMTLSPVVLEAGKTYRTKDGWITAPMQTKDGKVFSSRSADDLNVFGEPPFQWDINGKNIKSTHGFGGPNEMHDLVKEVIISSVKPKLKLAASTFLSKVNEIVTGPREKEYGDKTENHARIAKLWNMWLTETKEDGDAITPYDVATMMLMVKLARLMQSPGHQDSHIDIAGYVACMEEIYDRQ